MSGTGLLSISGRVFATPTSQGGEKSIAIAPINTTDAQYSETAVSLSSGDNTVSIPSGTTAVLFTPSTSNTTAWGLGASRAITSAAAKPLLWCPPSGTTSIVVNAAASMTLTVTTL